MALLSRRVTVGLLAAAVAAGFAGVSTWALADDAPAGDVNLIVGLRPDAGSPVADVLRRGGVDPRTADAAGDRPLALLHAHTLTVSAARRASVMARLRRDPSVAYVEPDRVRKTLDVQPNDPVYTGGNQPELPYLNVPAAWDQYGTGSAVTVAVVDTGVNPVGDLAGGAVLAGYDYVNNDSNPADDHGHGTMVSSLIAARGNNGTGMAGVCWACRILPVKVMDADGTGSDSTIAKGIMYAADHGAKVINMSLGERGSSTTLQNAVTYANTKGSVIVAAAGNDGTSDKFYPAALYDVLAVGATAKGSDARASFSNYGDWVDVAAPGDVAVMDRAGTYWTGAQGTSFAAPLVSGVAALLASHYPSYTGWSLSWGITHKAKPIGSWTMFGKVDAAAAFTQGTDTGKPVVTGISAPAADAKVHGVVTVKPTGVTDGFSGVRNVYLLADGKYVSQDNTSPYELKYDTAGRNGKVALQVKVYDKAGNTATYDRTVIADNTLPTVKITSGPANGATVSGNPTIAVSASDANGVNRVELLIDGKLTVTDRTSPYGFTIYSGPQKNPFTVQVRAYDNAGNVAYDAKRTWKK